MSPEAAAGGETAPLQDGDIIAIDIPQTRIDVQLSEDEINLRAERQHARGANAFKPVARDRKLSEALKAYAPFAASADRGAVREVPDM